MRILQIVGALLLAAGLFILIKSPTYPTEQSVFKLGDIEAKVNREQSVPPWIGGVALGAGFVLIVAGFRKK